MYRCLNHHKAEAISSLGLFFRAFRWIEEKAIFPVEGALLSQSYTFISACDFMKKYAAVHASRKRATAEKFKQLRKKK